MTIQQILTYVLGLLLLLLTSGCVVTLKKDASAGVRWSTDVAAYHNAPDDGSEARMDPTVWLQDLINKKLEENDEAPASDSPAPPTG